MAEALIRRHLDEIRGSTRPTGWLSGRMRAQWHWPAGMPLCRPMGQGLWEVRTELPSNRIARVFLCLDDGLLVALHAFIKKTQKTPDDELALARKREQQRWRVRQKCCDTGAVRAIFSPNGKSIAATSQHNGISVYETATLKRIGGLGSSSKPVIAIAYSPDGTKLVTGGAEPTIRVWDLSTSKELCNPGS